jgi:hypothetical protein
VASVTGPRPFAKDGRRQRLAPPFAQPMDAFAVRRSGHGGCRRQSKENGGEVPAAASGRHVRGWEKGKEFRPEARHPAWRRTLRRAIGMRDAAVSAGARLFGLVLRFGRGSSHSRRLGPSVQGF